MIRALGLMSGTSLDGVDAAILHTDGEDVAQLGPALTMPYEEDVRALLRRATEAVREAGPHAPLPDIAREAEHALTIAHATTVQRLLDEAAMDGNGVDVIGFHGQTVLHAPDRRRTIQIGDGPLLATRTGIDVVYDFRTADVAAGGQGAPLAPVYHRALARGLNPEGPVAVLNIGGVANVTWIGRDGGLLAFDTGPGNGLLDDWTRLHTGRAMDEDGRLARSGRVREDVLGSLLDHPYFDALPPKSLDRHDFSIQPARGLSPEDGAATLAAFTAVAVALSVQHMPEAPTRWLVCGGGRRNPVLLEALRTRLPRVEPVEAAGWRGDALEAEAFAYLAARALKGLPSSLPETTGVPEPMTAGRLCRA